MPEIWLKYGTTDVVLDIRFDNLASQVSSPIKPIPEEQVRSALEGVPLADNMLVTALSPSKSVSRAVIMLAEAARAKGFGVTIDVPARIAGMLRAQLTSLPGGEAIPINRVDHSHFHDRAGKFSSAISVSAVSYDPLFGFGGAPTAILRNFLPEKMEEAYRARPEDNIPSPGVEGNPLRIAGEAMQNIAATSVELVTGSSGIAAVHVGTLQDAFGEAVSDLRSMSLVEEDPSKCAVISASSEQAVQSNLSSSLNSLWNNIHIVKEGGVAVLLAECREGLGGGALQMFVEGRLKPDQVISAPYSDGLEHLVFAGELRKKYDLGLVSTLPRYYAGTMLGFGTYSGMSEVLQSLPEKLGKNYRAIVLSDSDITLVRPRI